MYVGKVYAAAWVRILLGLTAVAVFQELLKLHKQKLQLQQQQQVAAAVAAAQQGQQGAAQPQQQQQAAQVQPAQAAQPNPQLTAVAAPRTGAVLASTAVANLQVARLVSAPLTAGLSRVRSYNPPVKLLKFVLECLLVQKYLK